MKKIVIFMVVALLAAAFCAPVSANEHLPKVIDDAQVLTGEQYTAMRNQINGITEKYEMQVVVMILDRYSGQDIDTFAEDYYLMLDYGCGEERSGLILLINLHSREWSIRTFGDAIDAVTSRECDSIMEDVSDLLGSGEYGEAVQAALDDIAYEIYAYREVTPKELTIYIAIALGIGLIAGWITVSMMKSGMRTAVYQHGASDYLVSGSYDLHKSRDIFLYSHVSRRRRSNDSYGSRGGSGRSGGSSGRF